MANHSFRGPFQQAISGELSLPGLIEAATLLSNTGEVAQARQLYQVWIGQNSGHPQLYVAHFNSAALESQIQDHVAAAASLNASIALNPDFVPAYINLGRIYEDAGAIDRAIELWRLAADRTAPVNGSSVQYATTALTQMARVLSDAQRSEDAEEAIERCLDINPRQPDIIEQYTALRLAQCKWPIAASSEHLDRKTLLGGMHPLSLSAYTDDPLLQLASAYRYVKRAPWYGPHNRECDRRHAAIDLSGRRLRVGYVSSDLRDHAIGYLMAELFELHEKCEIEVFAYYCGPASNSALTNRIKSAVEHWVDIRNLSDDDAARRIAADGIDILVDVNGHTRDSRTGVFARRPAPIQVNWLGYPGSMGSPYHQYLIADEWIVPPDSEIYYSEKIVRLPCYQPNDRKRVVAAERPSRSAAGLPENALVFCCFNGTHKISRFTFNRWLEILSGVENSVLWLLDTSEKTKNRLRDLAEKSGVSGSRLIFAPKMQNPHHLARYQLADLFLDSTPYGAHTTASDALWMGIPVLTLSGRSFASRVCGSLVRSAGLADLVCTSPEEYVARAIGLAGNPAEIGAYKEQLRTNRDSCQLFNTELLVKSLETLYRTMCSEHTKGLVLQPDLTNLDVYFEVGIDHDHDSADVLEIADYRGTYQAKLEQYHLTSPLPADGRLWRQEDGAGVDGSAEKLPASVKSDVAALKDNGDILRHLARHLNAQHNTLECLRTLLAMKACGADPQSMFEEIRAVIDPAIQCFNQFAATGNIEHAVQYADALAALLPGNIAALNSALSCNVALHRKDRVLWIATQLVALDPSHKEAQDILSDTDAHRQVPAAHTTQNTIHPLIQLRDLYDEASNILCGTLTDEARGKVGRLQSIAQDIDVPVQDPELAGWEKHYRLAMRAIDMSDFSKPLPRPSKDNSQTRITFATASGKALDWHGVQAAAKKQRAKAVFFAAADRTYVDLYGRAYIESILDHSDVSSLIVLHVIGGAKNLPAVAKSIGISSSRLIFAGDNFDADSIRTKCYDAPPKGLSALPIAHLQSIRFLRVGALLQRLQLPVFVSDIDLILQRGVKDLTLKYKNHDMVLNENTENTNAGSRFTANLLLLNPTRNTALFLRFLRNYLENSLNGSEVSRWIDQFAILQARHYLLQYRPKARIGYFDVTADINNLMYPAYQEHPFRFLSLYHGFDMTSLPRRSRSRVRKPAPRKKATARGRNSSARKRLFKANN